MSYMITNQFRLVLHLRWSPHWYCPFPTFMVLNYVFCNNSLVIKERKFVRMFLVINEVSLDTCNIHQVKENAEVKFNRWLSIQTICGSTLVHMINSTHAAILKLDKGKRTEDLLFESLSLLWTDTMSFIHSRADDKSSADRLSMHCKPLYCPKRATRNLSFLSACRVSFLAFAFKIDSIKRSLQVFFQLENYFFPKT